MDATGYVKDQRYVNSQGTLKVYRYNKRTPDGPSLYSVFMRKNNRAFWRCAMNHVEIVTLEKAGIKLPAQAATVEL